MPCWCDKSFHVFIKTLLLPNVIDCYYKLNRSSARQKKEIDRQYFMACNGIYKKTVHTIRLLRNSWYACIIFIVTCCPTIDVSLVYGKHTYTRKNGVYTVPWYDVVKSRISFGLHCVKLFYLKSSFDARFFDAIKTYVSLSTVEYLCVAKPQNVGRITVENCN